MKRKNALRSASFFGLVGLVSLVPVSQVNAVNLLLNPGFEAPPAPPNTSNVIAGWTIVGDLQETLRATFANNTPGGQWSLWLKTFVFSDPLGNIEGITQDVTVVGGGSYTLSTNAYLEAAYPTTTARLKYGVSWFDNTMTPTGTATFGTILPSDPNPTNAWLPFSIAATAPANATKARIFLGWEDGGTVPGAQSAFYDDVVFDGPGSPPTGASWIVDGSGDWTLGGFWSTGTAPNAVDAEANLGAIITSAQTLYANSPITAGTINFDNANTYVIAGAGSLTLQVSSGGAALNVVQGTQKVNLPLHLGSNAGANVSGGATLLISDPVFLNGRTLTKSGAGTMIIEAPVRSSAAAAVIVNGGEARFDYGVGTPATVGNPAVANTAVSVSGASKTVFNADQTLRLLNVVTSLAGDQEVDLTTSRVRTYPANRANEELSIYNAIKAAYTSGSGKDGIYSSLDDAGANLSVGVTDQAVDAAGNLSVLVRLTRTGDANLDGITNIGDFSILGTNFNTSGRWDNGDFNFDGTVGIGDFSLLASNYNQSAPAAGARAGAVPEPAAFGVIGGAMALLAARRRRA